MLPCGNANDVAWLLNIKLKGEISMKRAFAVAAAAGLIFAACGGSDDPAAQPANEPAVTEAAAEPAAEPADEPAPAVEEEAAAASGLSVDTINVAYFEQWPTPNLLGFNDGSFDAAVGAEINWVPFGGGG
ncbi:MAG: hypothetical protein ACI9N0_000918, partial [Ilumatobacter sp.]